jgi:hypothetical protein
MSFLTKSNVNTVFASPDIFASIRDMYCSLEYEGPADFKQYVAHLAKLQSAIDEDKAIANINKTLESDDYELLRYAIVRLLDPSLDVEEDSRDDDASEAYAREEETYENLRESSINTVLLASRTGRSPYNPVHAVNHALKSATNFLRNANFQSVGMTQTTFPHGLKQTSCLRFVSTSMKILSGSTLM